MYQNFVTDLIQYPNMVFTNYTTSIRTVQAADVFFSTNIPVSGDTSGAYVFEIDPTKDTLFSVKASLLNGKHGTVLSYFTLELDAPIPSSGDFQIEGGTRGFLVPSSVSLSSDTSASFVWNERVLLPSKMNKHNGKYHYVILDLNSQGENYAWFTFAARSHYKDFTVYQPSK